VRRGSSERDGRTASEIVRRTHIGEDGTAQTLHEEYAVMDRSGRLQIPKDYRTALGLKDRVRLDLEDDHLGVWADGTPRKPKPAPVAAAIPVAAAVTEPAPVAEVDSIYSAPVAAAPTSPVPVPIDAPTDDVAFTPPATPDVVAPVAVAPVVAAPVLPPVVETPSKPSVPTPLSGLPRVTFQEVPEQTPTARNAEKAASAMARSIEANPDEEPYMPQFAPREDVAPPVAPPVATPTADPAEPEAPVLRQTPPRSPWLPIGDNDD